MAYPHCADCPISIHLSGFADVAPPFGVELIVALQYSAEHFRVVFGIERFIAA